MEEGLACTLTGPLRSSLLEESTPALSPIQRGHIHDLTCPRRSSEVGEGSPTFTSLLRSSWKFFLNSVLYHCPYRNSPFTTILSSFWQSASSALYEQLPSAWDATVQASIYIPVNLTDLRGKTPIRSIKNLSG